MPTQLKQHLGLSILVFMATVFFYGKSRAAEKPAGTAAGKSHHCLQFYFREHGAVVDHPGPWFFS